MLARLQQFMTIGLLAVAWAWAAHFLGRGEPGWALGGALLILFGYVLVLAFEFVLLARVNRADPAPRASFGQWVRAWWGEVLTAPRVFCWRQPFRSKAEPDVLPERPDGHRGMVLVHGFICNRAVWNPWMRRLRAQGVPFIAVNLEPVFGTIDDYPAILDRAVQRMAQATGMAPLIVAHSMGGLAVRAWLDAHGADARVHHVVTVGAPHHGTCLGRYGLTPNTRQMRRGNRWLAELARREPAERFARFTCFYSHCDNVVFPASTATLVGAENRHVPGMAHVQLLYQAVVYDAALLKLNLEP